MDNIIEWIRGDKPLPLTVNTDLTSTTQVVTATNIQTGLSDTLTCTPVNAALGQIKVEGAALDTVGVYKLEVEVSQNGSVVATYPNDGSFVLNVKPDAGSLSPVDALDGLLANLPGFALLSPAMKADALGRSLMPDSFGVWPGQLGYEFTYDVYWAAMNLIGFLQAQPVVRQSSSEGTSVAVDAPSWSALLMYYRSSSPIAAAVGNSVLQTIDLPDDPHVIRTNMSGQGGGPYDDVDTDLA